MAIEIGELITTDVPFGQLEGYKVVLTAAQVRGLNAAAVEVVPAPGSGKFFMVDKVIAKLPAGTAFDDIAATEDIIIAYGNSTDAVVAIETIGFLDQATLQRRIAYPRSGLSNAIPRINQPLRISNSGAITAGRNGLIVAVYGYTVFDNAI